jgi:hypothetical protein
MGIRKQLIIQN